MNRRTIAFPFTIIRSSRGWWVVATDESVEVACVDPVVAERIATLLDRHGLVDVPDDASSLTEGRP